MVLSEEPDSQTGILRDEPGCGLEFADEEFQDGRFTGAVGSDEADSRIELYVEVDVAEEDVVSGVAECYVGHLDYGW